MADLKLRYFFDPLCGWCYASAPTLTALNDAFPGLLELLPSGLFTGKGARQMTPEWAQFAWTHDQRIQHLTGQPFTALYRQQVLEQPQGWFDSGPVTRGMTLIRAIAPTFEVPLLQRLQQCRYVGGADTAKVEVVAGEIHQLLQENGVSLESYVICDRLRFDETLAMETQQRIKDAQSLMQEHNIQGVPQLLVEYEGKHLLMEGEMLFQEASFLISTIVMLGRGDSETR